MCWWYECMGAHSGGGAGGAGIGYMLGVAADVAVDDGVPKGTLGCTGGLPRAAWPFAAEGAFSRQECESAPHTGSGGLTMSASCCGG
jgi:hypothetical protein